MRRRRLGSGSNGRRVEEDEMKLFFGSIHDGDIVFWCLVMGWYLAWRSEEFNVGGRLGVWVMLFFGGW